MLKLHDKSIPNASIFLIKTLKNKATIDVILINFLHKHLFVEQRAVHLCFYFNIWMLESKNRQIILKFKYIYNRLIILQEIFTWREFGDVWRFWKYDEEFLISLQILSKKRRTNKKPLWWFWKKRNIQNLQMLHKF